MATPLPAAEVHEIRRAAKPGGVEDRYRSLFLVGRGGMGSVEVALEQGEAGFERVVALKRLLPESRDPRHKEMFLREARLAALLEHANVVHAYAFGELYGELFLAMEYVEGEPLSRVLARLQERRSDAGGKDGAEPAGLEPALVCHVLAQVCDGLHAAHELRDAAGQLLHVVHRDVSPHNVMIAYDGHVKILDFGVAKFDTGGHETRTGEVKGKMAYMSPEQALGEKLDRRSDLYSVGAVLFECITGRRMWGNGTDLEVMRKLALEEPPRLADAMPGAPEALARLHARLIARDLAERPATAEDAAKELRAIAGAGANGDACAAVAKLMQRLFADEARERRAQLTDALRLAAPSRVDSLRRTVEPQHAFDGPTVAEPVILGTKEEGAAVAPARGGRGRSWLLAGAVGVAVAGGVAVLASGMGRGRTASSTADPSAAVGAGTTATPAAIPIPTPVPIPIPIPAPAATPTEAPTATATAATPPPPPPTATIPSTPLQGSPAGWRARPRPAPPRPRGSATSKLPDVDPTPF